MPLRHCGIKMSEKRTTKSIAARIQLDYLHRFQPLKYWKRVTIISVISLVSLWAFFELSPGRKMVYSPGPVSKGHKIFEKNCSECHTQSFQPISNDTCLRCHNDLGHHAAVAIKTPRCTECHVEHRQQPLVTTPTAANCASCHVDLQRQIKKGQKISQYAASIATLDKGHPEFRFLDPQNPEASRPSANIKFNHKAHLKPDIEKADGTRTTLQCIDCHAVDTKTDPQGRFRNAAFNYEAQCQSCHTLGFDIQFPVIEAPHEKPEIIREFLKQFYTNILEKDPTIYQRPPERSRPGPKARQSNFATGEEWKKFKITTAEKDLLGRSCLECHTWKYETGTLPQVAPVKLPPPALKLGRFDHAAHRRADGVDCLSCHTGALTSEKTSDQLIPGIQNCLQCHTQGGIGNSSCYECHRYHSEGNFKKF